MPDYNRWKTRALLHIDFDDGKLKNSHEASLRNQELCHALACNRAKTCLKRESSFETCVEAMLKLRPLLLNNASQAYLTDITDIMVMNTISTGKLQYTSFFSMKEKVLWSVLSIELEKSCFDVSGQSMLNDQASYLLWMCQKPRESSWNWLPIKTDWSIVFDQFTMHHYY